MNDDDDPFKEIEVENDTMADLQHDHNALLIQILFQMMQTLRN